MAEILTEQIEAVKDRQRDFGQMPTTTTSHLPSSTGKKDEGQKEPKQTLPKGVVLDKDGKPFVSFIQFPSTQWKREIHITEANINF